MSIKNYAFILGLLTMFSVSAFAQDEATTTAVYRGAGYDILDTTVIPAKRMEQQKDFLDNNYDFPAKPRNQWEFGVSGGLLNVSGDVRTKTPFNAKNPGQTMGFGLHLRKAWGYILSTRLQYIHGNASGFNWQGATGYWGHNTPWMNVADGSGKKYGTATTANSVVYNYKTTIDELSLQLLASLNNIKFHKARNKASIYAIAGIGGAFYETWVNALKGKNLYDFQSVLNKNNATTTNAYKTRKAKNENLLNS